MDEKIQKIKDLTSVKERLTNFLDLLKAKVNRIELYSKVKNERKTDTRMEMCILPEDTDEDLFEKIAEAIVPVMEKQIEKINNALNDLIK